MSPTLIVIIVAVVFIGAAIGGHIRHSR